MRRLRLIAALLLHAAPLAARPSPRVWVANTWPDHRGAMLGVPSGAPAAAGCTAAGVDATCYGVGAAAGGSNAAAFGKGTSANGNGSTIVGQGSTDTGNSFVEILGASSAAGASEAIVIGRAGFAGGAACIAIGPATQCTGANSAVLGKSANDGGVNNSFELGTAAIPLNVNSYGKIVSNRTTDLGWVPASAANQACNTTCTSACVVGFDTVAGSIVGLPLLCTDATADTCICAGP